MKSRAAYLLAVLTPALATAQENSFELGAMPPPKAPPPLYVSTLEAGIGYQSEDSFFQGRYGGPTEEGPFAILRGTLDGGDAWDGEGIYWNATFDVRGYDTLSFEARYGRQGHWRVSAFYDAFTRAYTETARSPFIGSGTAALTLPGNWLTGASSSQFATLTQNLKPMALKVEWKKAGGEFLIVPREGYEARIGFNYRNRQGLRAQSLPFGHEGNFAVGVFFPEPIDYDSHQLTASLAYAGGSYQWTANYSLAIFTNNIDPVSLPNPYLRSLGTPWPGGSVAGYPLNIGQYGPVPDTVAHQFVFSGGYAVTPKTRLTARFSFALQRQNDDFLPYTNNPFFTVPVPLPRESFDGKVRKTHLALTLTSREWRDFDFSAGYILDDRDNRSPVDVYTYVANDVQDQPQPLVPGNSRYIRINLPHSFTFHQVKAEAGYRVLPRTRLSLAYTGDFKERTLQQVRHTEEHALRAKALTNFSAGSAWLAYAYANRTGSRYDDALPWDLSHTVSYLNAAPTNQSIEHPLLRKFHLADRRRHEVKGGATFDLTPALGVNASGGFSENRYSRSPLGLRYSSSLMLDADVSYTLEQHLTASVFYAFERIRLSQNGYFIFDLNETDPQRFWNVLSRDMVNTAGLRLDWQAVPDKLKLGGSYYVSDGISRIITKAAPLNVAMVTAPLPDGRVLTHNLGLVGEYAFRPGTALRLGYTVERHSTRDWQYDNMGFTPVDQILASGILPPRYTAHIVWVTARYQF